MSLLSAYIFFLAKIATIVVAILILLAGILALVGSNKGKTQGKISIKKINEKFSNLKELIAQETVKKKSQKNKSEKKSKKKKSKTLKARLFILNFNGDINANETHGFREMITAIILSKKDNDRVLIKLQSGGGLVNSYGLASSQIQRLKAAEIHTTVAIDKVAASGGYMMAAVADHIIAAPFAIVGSIGVLAQIPNFNRLLDKNAIDFEQISAGQYKRTLSLFGKNTPEGREKFQDELEKTHVLFQQHIALYRPGLDMNTVATGEHWYGSQALDLKLVDEIKTSDDFILESYLEHDLFELSYCTKKSLMQRLAQGPQNLLRVIMQLRGQPGQDFIV